MVWVRKEYAGELAVLSTWFAGLIPWNVAYASDVAGGQVLFVRFPLFQVRYTFGLPFIRGTLVGLPLPPPVVDTSGFVVSAIGFQAGTFGEFGYQIWAAGALVYAVALGISIAYYHDEERVEDWRVDPVLLLGGLLTLAGLLLGAASVALWGMFGSIAVPLGVVFMVAFGLVLIAAERREVVETDD